MRPGTGSPSRSLSTRLDTAESAALPLGEARLLSISRSGELAVIVKDYVLARVPLGGAGTRDWIDQVADADWAPDGSLAVVRQDENIRRAWVEYPVGKRSCTNPRMRCTWFAFLPMDPCSPSWSSKYSAEAPSG